MGGLIDRDGWLAACVDQVILRAGNSSEGMSQ
jgi:hypothetical protein